MKGYEMNTKLSVYETCVACGGEFTITAWVNRVDDRHDECPPTQEGEQQ